MISSQNRDPSRISANGLTVRFGKVLALDHFTINIPRGIVGLLGPNSAGKSTFIKTMLGLVNPQSGEMLIDNVNPRTDITTVRDNIGYMPENDCLIDEMNPVELVSYMGRISGMEKNDSIQRTHEILDFVGLGEERYRKIGSYSTGMKQKAKLAQAIVHDPNILFLDEPTNGLDPQGRDEMLDLIKKIGKSGKTLLVSSHILHEIEQVSSYVIIINHGKLVKDGPTQELMNPDKTRFRLKIRGETSAIDRFLHSIETRVEVISRIDESNQLSLSIICGKGNSFLFASAREHGIQIRHFGPDTLTLEDVFVQTFQGGG